MGTKKDKYSNGYSHPPDRGGKPNKENLTRKYFFLIAKIVQNFEEVPVSRENLENAGYIGLLNAANLYDRKTHKIDFKSYAQIMITNEIHHYLANQKHETDQPAWLVRLNQNINRFVLSYRRKEKRFPRLSEIADHVNITSTGLQEILKDRETVREAHLAHHLQSELAAIQPEWGKIRSQSYQPFKLPIEDVIVLQKAFLKIKEIQHHIIHYLFVMDLCQTEAAKKLGLSSGISEQIKKDISKHLF